MSDRSKKHYSIPSPSPMIKHCGLTLVELLVAISILGFVAVLGWRGLDSIVRARITLTSDLEQTRGMQLTFAQLQIDCAHLVSSSILPNRVPIAIEQGRLILVRTVFSENQPSRLQIVTYSSRGGKLTRHESVATRDLVQLDAMWKAAADDTITAGAVTLQSDVSALTMRLWINGGWRSGIETMALASTAGSSTAPLLSTGLEVMLLLRGRDTGLLKVFLLGAV